MRGSVCGVLGSISIHALREEGDNSCKSVSQLRFISIHALREEGDPSLTASPTTI